MAYSGRTYNTQRFINGNGFSSPTNHVMPLPKDPLEGVVKDEKARIARINPEQPPVGYKNLNTFARSPQSFRSPKTFTHSQRTVSPRSFTQSQRTVSPRSFTQSQRTVSPRSFTQSQRTVSPRSFTQSQRTVSPRSFTQSQRTVSPRSFTQSQRTVSPRSFTQSQRTVSPGSFAQSQRTISPSRTFGRTNGTIVKSPKINTFSSPQRSGRNLNTMTFNGNRTF